MIVILIMLVDNTHVYVLFQPDDGYKTSIRKLAYDVLRYKIIHHDGFIPCGNLPTEATIPKRNSHIPIYEG